MAEQALKYISKDESMVFSAIKSEMNRLDWETQLNLTRAEGEARGKAEREIEIAKNSLKEGFTPLQISKITGLSIQEIEKIKGEQ